MIFIPQMSDVDLAIHLMAKGLDPGQTRDLVADRKSFRHKCYEFMRTHACDHDSVGRLVDHEHSHRYALPDSLSSGVGTCVVCQDQQLVLREPGGIFGVPWGYGSDSRPEPGGGYRITEVGSDGDL